MKKYLFILSATAALLMSACTSIEVTPIPKGAEIAEVKIEMNEKVKVTDFVPVMQDAFAKHGIQTQVVASNYQGREGECTISYSALRSWDFAPYLADAYVHVKKDGVVIGRAKYHHYGGFSLLKWQGTETKMTPVYEELLKEYPKIPDTMKSAD